jgi:predicted peptidase
MYRAFCWAIVCSGLLAPCWASQTTQVFQRTISRAVGYHYLLNLPEGYREGSGKKWPLLLFLHGLGERGSDIKEVTKHGVPKLLATDKTHPPADIRERESVALLREHFIVVSPQCPANADWDDDTIMALLDEVIAHRDADTTRVYFTGISLGGYAVWSIGLKHPERFAALIPICGGGSMADVYRATSDRFVDLPIWAFHGGRDGLVPPDESRRMISAARNVGVKEARLTVFPEAEHDAWTQAYADPDLYRWLLWHHR